MLRQKMTEELNGDLIKKYPGKWIARTDSKIIAVGDSINDVIKMAEKKKVKNPIVSQVPTRRHNFSFF
ncbi:MAG: DUF5678 domain-containing protein [Candidatus Subteraquimicrobiales bacterium]|nr:DUF5678 domain-containing protein [Candidatus Subteraquimicrobiales bacterium]